MRKLSSSVKVGRKLRNAILIVLTLGVAGCGGAYFTMNGAVDGGQELFTGTMIRRFNDEGDLQFRTTSGRTCTGKIPLFRGRVAGATQAQGTVTCSDGQTGTFDFAGEDLRGNGRGTIGGRPFVFTVMPGPGGL